MLIDALMVVARFFTTDQLRIFARCSKGCRYVARSEHTLRRKPDALTPDSRAASLPVDILDSILRGIASRPLRLVAEAFLVHQFEIIARDKKAIEPVAIPGMSADEAEVFGQTQVHYPENLLGANVTWHHRQHDFIPDRTRGCAVGFGRTVAGAPRPFEFAVLTVYLHFYTGIHSVTILVNTAPSEQGRSGEVSSAESIRGVFWAARFGEQTVEMGPAGDEPVSSWPSVFPHLFRAANSTIRLEAPGEVNNDDVVPFDWRAWIAELHVAAACSGDKANVETASDGVAEAVTCVTPSRHDETDEHDDDIDSETEGDLSDIHMTSSDESDVDGGDDRGNRPNTVPGPDLRQVQVRPAAGDAARSLSALFLCGAKTSDEVYAKLESAHLDAIGRVLRHAPVLVTSKKQFRHLQTPKGRYYCETGKSEIGPVNVTEAWAHTCQRVHRCITRSWSREMSALWREGLVPVGAVTSIRVHDDEKLRTV